MHHYPWVILNLLLHGGAVALLLLLAAFIWRDHRQRVDARLAAAVAVGGAAFALVATPGVQLALAPWHAPLMALSAANPLVFWLLSRALLDDEFALRRWHLLAWIAMATIGVSLSLVPFEVSDGRLWLAVPALAWMLLTAVQTFASWRDDLVERRRRMRLSIIVAGMLYLLGTHAMLLAVRQGLLWTNTVSAAALLVLGIVIAWRLLRPSPDLFIGVSPALQPAAPAPPREPDTALGEPMPVEPPDPRLIDALNALMQVEQVYREENLTIAGLAQRMKLSEPRLRQLINKELGHRNFNAFLNAYRVADAKRSLEDPRYAEVPILTISVEAGFQSLGPFNRAFKAATGMTPSDFRRAAAPRPSAFG